MSSPRQRSQFRFWQRWQGKLSPAGIPVGWMCLTAIAYAAAGTILSSFPAPYWVWNLAAGGTIAQSLALAGPKSLRRFRWWFANLLALLAIVGTGAMGVALSTALGYVGTDNLDDIVLEATAYQVIRVSLLAIVVAALGAIISAETGDRLLKTFGRLQTMLILAANCILGLMIGALIGLLISME